MSDELFVPENFAVPDGLTADRTSLHQASGIWSLVHVERAGSGPLVSGSTLALIVGHDRPRDLLRRTRWRRCRNPPGTLHDTCVAPRTVRAA